MNTNRLGSRLLFLLSVLFMPHIANAAFNMDVGYVLIGQGTDTVCPYNSSNGYFASELGNVCSDWCHDEHGSTYPYTNAAQGTAEYTNNMIVAIPCAYIAKWDPYGVYPVENDQYCCVNNSVTAMGNCKCPNGKTSFMGDSLVTAEYTSDNDIRLTCHTDYYCYCSSGYTYGPRETLNNASANCGTCPSMPPNNYGYMNSTITGLSWASYAQVSNNAMAPSTTLADCAIRWSPTPSPMGDYHDETGTWRIASSSNPCY